MWRCGAPARPRFVPRLKGRIEPFTEMSRRIISRGERPPRLPAPRRPRAFAFVILALAYASASVAPCVAQVLHAAQAQGGARTKAPPTPPLPPSRPQELSVAPPACANGCAVAPPAPAPATIDQNVDDGRAFRPLPAASRARMRACGDEWRKLKLEGAARDRNWRDFADVCLRQ